MDFPFSTPTRAVVMAVALTTRTRRAAMNVNVSLVGEAEIAMKVREIKIKSKKLIGISEL